MGGRSKPRTLRVCIHNPTRLLKRPVAQLASMLSQQMEVSLLYPRRLFTRPDRSLSHSQLAEGVREITYPSMQPPVQYEQPIPCPSFLLAAWRALRDHDIVHIWVPCYLSSFILLLMRRLFFRRTRLVLTMDTVPGVSFSLGRALDVAMRAYYRLFRRTLFETPDAVTLYGKSLIEYAQRVGVPLERIHVVPTGITAKKGPSRATARRALRVGDRFVILFAGLLVDRKGVADLLRAVARLHKQQLNARHPGKKGAQGKHAARGQEVLVLVAGDGPRRARLERLADDLGVADRVRFLGFRKDMDRLYAAADAFVLPSYGEGLPGVVMEAMAAGVPVVSTAIPCTTDLITHATHGLLIMPGDWHGLAQQIEAVGADTSLRRSLARKAREKVHKAYNWQDVRSRYAELYRSLLT